MRVLIAATIAASLVATNLLAAEATAPAKAPLAPGNAAGVKKAQAYNDDALWLTLAGVAGVAIGFAAMSGHGSQSFAAAAVSTTATTAT